MNCKFCGKPATLEFGDVQLCEECYYLAGSCCREFGADDLWREREEESAHRCPPGKCGEPAPPSSVVDQPDHQGQPN
jgi:hypothetical protein